MKTHSSNASSSSAKASKKKAQRKRAQERKKQQQQQHQAVAQVAIVTNNDELTAAGPTSVPLEVTPEQLPPLQLDPQVQQLDPSPMESYIAIEPNMVQTDDNDTGLMLNDENNGLMLNESVEMNASTESDTDNDEDDCDDWVLV